MKSTNSNPIRYFPLEASKWIFVKNNAVKELLDHLADELAIEYVMLMEESRGKEGAVK